MRLVCGGMMSGIIALKDWTAWPATRTWWGNLQWDQSWGVDVVHWR